MPEAWNLAGFACGRELPELDAIVGNAMVDRETYLPVGFALAYFEPCGIVSIQAAFGEYFRQFPKDILAGMAPIAKVVVESGVDKFYAVADEEITGSIDLIKWMGGEKTGDRSEHPPVGDIYTIDTHGPRMTAWMARRG